MRSQLLSCTATITHAFLHISLPCLALSVSERIQYAIAETRKAVNEGRLECREADVWSTICWHIARDEEDQRSESGSDHSSSVGREGGDELEVKNFARNIDVGERVRKEGYRHTSAYIFAPKWTAPGRNSLSITENKVLARFGTNFSIRNEPASINDRPHLRSVSVPQLCLPILEEELGHDKHCVTNFSN